MTIWNSVYPSDPHWGNVVSLLHFNGTNASTTFTDQKGKTWTANGNAQISTAQSKFGGAAGLFDGTGDFLTVPDSTDFYISGDYTIECWIRPATVASNRTVISKRENVANNNDWALAINSAAKLVFVAWNNATTLITMTGPTSISVNTWNHIAMSRTGTSWGIYLNGTQETRGTEIAGTASHTYVVRVGRDPTNTAQDFNGYIDDLRLTKGVGRYRSASFQVPPRAYSNSWND